MNRMKVLSCWEYDLDLTDEQINQLLQLSCVVPCAEEDVIYCYEEEIGNIFNIVNNNAHVIELEDYIKCFDGGSYLQIELSKISNNHVQIGMDECIKHMFQYRDFMVIESRIIAQSDRCINSLISDLILKESTYIITEYIEMLKQAKKDITDNKSSWYIR